MGRQIRGVRSPTDDEPTLEAPPEEATLSAQVDVRAAFERANALSEITSLADTANTSLEKTVPGIPGAPFGEDPTMPASVRPAETTLVMPPEARHGGKNPFQQEHTEPHRERVGTAPQSSSIASSTSPVSDVAPSSPRVLAAPKYQADEEEYVPPGVASKRPRRIAIGILAVCVLLCGLAAARQYFGSYLSAPPPPPSPTPAPTPSAPPQPTAAATSSTPATSETETVPAPASATASAVASAPPAASSAHHVRTLPKHALPPITHSPPAPKPPPPSTAAPTGAGIDRNNPF